MKNIYLCIYALLITGFMQAQITITSNDMPATNDTIRTSSTVFLDGVDYTLAGEDISWDFTSLEALDQTVDTFVSVYETPLLYQFVFSPILGVANLAQPITGFDYIPGLEITDVYRFYKNTSNDFRDVGFALTVSLQEVPIPLPIKYDNPDIYYSFPMNYGQEDSVYSDYVMEMPDLFYAGGWKQRISHVDGWGTLKTPFGTFQTLRIKSDIEQYDSVYIDSLGIGFPMHREYTEYKWLGNGYGLPLMQVTKEGIIETATYIDSVRQLPFAVPESIVYEEQLVVYPNPIKEQFSMRFLVKEKGLVVFHLYDSRGILVEEIYKGYHQPGISEITIDLPEGRYPGLFFIRMIQSGIHINKKIIIE